MDNNKQIKLLYISENMIYAIGKEVFYIMKKIGVYRRVDELGRIVITKDIRKALEINIKDSIEIYTDGNSIILKKLEDNCIFCGKTKDITQFNDKMVCSKCIQSIMALK